MTSNTFSEQDVRRDAGGRFDRREHTSPDVVLGFDPHTGIRKDTPELRLQEAAAALYLDEHERAVAVELSASEAARATRTAAHLGRVIGGFRAKKKAAAVLSSLHAEGIVEPLGSGGYRLTELGNEYLRQQGELDRSRRRTVTTINPES